MLPFFRLIRLPNLIMVFITQYLLEYCVILPIFARTNTPSAFDHLHFFLFAMTTMLITAGGYIINDITDAAIDCINKPEKYVIGKLISYKTAYNLYYAFVALSLVIGTYTGYYVGSVVLALAYPLVTVLLWLYSASLKNRGLVGNLLVALLCAFTATILVLGEAKGFRLLKMNDAMTFHRLWLVVVAYSVFAFLGTIFRELIKDIEDITGDRAAGRRTFPIVFGLSATKKLTMALMGLLFICLGMYINVQAINVSLFILSISIGLSIVYIIWKLIIASEKADFAHLSFAAKCLMLVGLLNLLFV
jgi:4-hydroxybenzoate polyprenyltransferase